jgi:replication initiator protein
LTPVSALIRVHSPALRVTKRRLKQLESIQLIRQQRDNGKQDLAFHARPFVLRGIPLRRPPRNQTSHTRRNGRFFLQIIGYPEFGLPFGQDRLIPIWVATLALRQKSRVVQFQCLTDFLCYFDLPATGHYYKRTASAFQRIFGSTIFFGTDERRNQEIFLDWARFHFFDQLRLWYSRQGNLDSASISEFQNTITLSRAFFAEIQGHPIPVERRVVAALSNAPGILDFYTWLTWKCWTTKSSVVRIPLFW